MPVVDSPLGDISRSPFRWIKMGRGLGHWMTRLLRQDSTYEHSTYFPPPMMWNVAPDQNTITFHIGPQSRQKHPEAGRNGKIPHHLLPYVESCLLQKKATFHIGRPDVESCCFGVQTANCHIAMLAMWILVLDFRWSFNGQRVFLR